MEAHRGEIFHLYIVQKKSLSEVRAILKQDHGLDISPKVFKTNLGRWGYTKNVKRSEVLEVLRQQSCRERDGKDSTFTLRQRPADLEKILRHGQRAALHSRRPGDLFPSSQNASRDVVSRTPPPPLPQSLPIFERWRIPEKLLYDFDVLVKGSFESGRWRFNGNNLIINSSPSGLDEKRLLHDFLGNIINGQDAVRAGDFELAGACWRHAFIGVESLVSGQHHDIIPNLIQQINDLSRNGLGDVAGLLKTHVARCSATFIRNSDGPTPSIFHGLGVLDMSLMVQVEERIMKRFKELFELYLGPLCYSSFVTMMDGARRRLLYDKWATLDECLPNTSHIDRTFGASDRRLLDVLGLRIEILSQRNMQNQAELEATLLIERADMIQNDEWLRFYNLTRGWYFLGSAQYMLKKRNVAIESLTNALQCKAELCKIEDFHIFVAEEATILRYLEDLKSDCPPEIQNESESNESME